MKALSLYVEKNSPIHKVDPINKLLYILAAIFIPIILPIRTVAYACLIMSVVILLIARVFKKVIPLIGFSVIILLSIVIIQGIFRQGNITPLFRIGPAIFYKEGLDFALGICIRVFTILCSFAILVLTTKPSDLIETLVRKGLSPRIGYVLSSVLQIIPQMTSTMGTIMDAQRSRGMETEGKLSVRIKAFFPLIGPVVMNSLTNTRERAMALEVRAFNSKVKKTFLNEEEKYSFNVAIRFILIALIIAAVIWRILL